jgi:hypothetical protein
MARVRVFDWDLISQRATKHPIQFLVLMGIYAFLAGLGTAILLGAGRLRMPIGVVIYATLCSFLCTFIFGFALLKSIRRESNNTIKSRELT